MEKEKNQNMLGLIKQQTAVKTRRLTAAAVFGARQEEASTPTITSDPTPTTLDIMDADDELMA